ncbi:hypothetical protein ACFWXO_30970 [Kitasatospora sp. NPDC059088]|uniref:hypothetical protein n=1 Tax=Kitasatospora sp. NPDC059088 TaxID=3346722 RepID=UPI0036C690FE
MRDLDERIAQADLRTALATEGPAGLIRRWSELAGGTEGLDSAVRGWLAEVHPGLTWRNTGRNRQRPVFPVYLWAGLDEAGGAAVALDGLAGALRPAQEDGAFPGLEVRVMKPRHDPPLLMSPFAEDPAATLTITPDGWAGESGGRTTSVGGSCLPLLTQAIRSGVDARAAEATGRSIRSSGRR